MIPQLALIVSFRDREAHLEEFLEHVPRYVRMQGIETRTIVVHQKNKLGFGRGTLRNIGAMINGGSCPFLCFHDVDEIPINADYSLEDLPARVYGRCTRPPRKTYDRRYPMAFGGVSIVSVEDFTKANGYSNLYVGWGGEDDDMGARLRHRVRMPVQREGLFRNLPHPVESGKTNKHHAKNFARRKRAFAGEIPPDDGFDQLGKTIQVKILAERVLRKHDDARMYDVHWYTQVGKGR